MTQTRAVDRPAARNTAVPGPDGVPVLGVLPQFARDHLGFTLESVQEYGRLVRWPFPTEDVYVVADPEAIEQILVHDNEQYVKGERFQQSLRPVLGNGILTSEGEFWRSQRRQIEPAFHPDRIERYASIMSEQTAATIDEWEAGDRLDVHETFSSLTLAIVAEALFGVDVRDRAGDVAGALDTVTEYAEAVSTNFVPLSIPTPLNRRMQEAKHVLDEIAFDIIEERRAAPGDDVVSQLLDATDEDGDPMSDEQLRDEVLTLLLAGHETTALALTYATYALARQPEVEARLVEELDTVLDGALPTVADLDECSYTEQVVQEALRLYPPAYGLLREPTTDVELCGYPIPAGSSLSIPQFAVHRDPAFYDDPMAFRPQRWVDDLEAQLPPYAYFPFSGGPRRCIGDRFALLEARLLLATIFRRYHLELVSSPSIDLTPGITMRPADPIEVRVHER